jgi:HSP20 family protein
MDIAEESDRFTVSVELPGMRKEDVRIELHDGVLSLHGEKAERREEKDRTLHLVERRFGSFHRSFALPSSVDAERIDAKFSDGVLEVTLPKRESSTPREVKIR